MAELIAGLRIANAAVFSLLAAASFVHWKRRGGAAAAWLAASFGVLAIVLLEVLIFPEEPTGVLGWVRTAIVAAVFLFPYLLYRFTSSFGRPSRRIDLLALALTALVVVWAFAVLSPLGTGSDDGRSAAVQTFLIAVMVQWVTLSLIGARKLWAAGRRQPTPARRRMRLLSGAAVALSAAIILTASSESGGSVALGVQFLSLASGVLFFLGFSPPPWLRLVWRRPEEEKLQKALGELMTATAVEAVTARLLPRVVDILAGRGAALLDDGGRIIGRHGDVPDDIDRMAEGQEAGDERPDLLGPDVIRVRMPSGSLLVWAGPYAPFFAQDELEQLSALATLDLAVGRAKLGEEAARLAEVVHSSGDAIITRDPAGTITSWNPGAQEIYGYSAEEAVGRPISMLVPPDRVDEIPEILERTRRGERIDHYETVRRRKDGRLITVSLSVAPIKDADGKVLGAATIARDVTDRIRADQTIRDQAEMLDQAQDSIMARDLSGRITYWNTGAAEAYGFSKEEALGRIYYELLGTEFPRPPSEIEAEVLRNGRWEGELAYTHKDGSRGTVSTRWTLRRDDRGDPVGVMHVATDITERKRAEEALRQSERRTRHIIDTAVEAFVSIDAEGRIVEWNPESERVFGWSRQEAVGRLLSDTIVPQRYRGAHTRGLEHYLATGEGPLLGRRIAIEALHRDGSELPVELTISSTDLGSGVFFNAFLRDMTERKRGEEALQAAKEEAERANLAKSEFLSRMSHELRTPLNAILGFGQLLEMEELTEDKRQNVTEILRGGEHLLDLINEVLDIARIEAGKLPISVEPVAVDDVVSEALNLIRPLADQRGLALESPETQCRDLHVMADKQRLKQVLLNLLSNAVKYNVDGGVVRLSCQASGERARISVSDTGPGIPEEKLDQLFVPFERLDAEGGAEEGAGLGLALAKRLVEAMGGMVDVESEMGKGSTFWVELPEVEGPIRRAQVSDEEVSGDDVAGGPRPTRTVLYVEDNLANLKLIQRILAKRPEITLLTAMQGHLGLELAKQHQPDLVLLDLQLPDVAGKEVLRRLKADDRTRDIPVVVVSADVTEGQTRSLLEDGARAYLTKPLNIQQFLRILEEELGHHHDRAAAHPDAR